MMQIKEDDVAKTFVSSYQDKSGDLLLESNFNNYGSRGYVDVVYLYEKISQKLYRYINLIEIKSKLDTANKVLRQLKKYENNYLSGTQYNIRTTSNAFYNKQIFLFIVANKVNLKHFEDNFSLYKNWLQSNTNWNRQIRFGLPQDSEGLRSMPLTAGILDNFDSLQSWYKNSAWSDCDKFSKTSKNIEKAIL